MANIARKMLHGFSTLTSPVDQHYDGGRIITHEDLLDSTTISEDSADSGASSPLEFMDHASTTSSLLPSQTVSDGPLYELASLMVNLPIKRGLSKYFEGKSQSFTSLSCVSSIEDLAKREIPLRKRIKSCKSCASFPDGSRSSTQGICRRTITKKPVRGSGSCLPAKINCSFVVSRSPHSTKATEKSD